MASNTVKVATPTSHGSGAFIANDLVVTAAHVIHPDDRAKPWPAGKLTVTLFDGTKVKAIGRICHVRWTDAFGATADMAVVRVASPQPNSVVAFASDEAADDRRVSITGFWEGPNEGTVSTEAGASGRDLLASDDLVFHEGVSGAPIVDGGIAIGIATRSPDSPTPGALIGVPFLNNANEQNLEWLIANCP